MERAASAEAESVQLDVAGTVNEHRVVEPAFTVTVPVGVPANWGATWTVITTVASSPKVAEDSERLADGVVVALVTARFTVVAELTAPW